MSIDVTILAGTPYETIYDNGRGQVLRGVASAVINVHRGSPLSPLPLELSVVLFEGRYVVRALSAEAVLIDDMNPNIDLAPLVDEHGRRPLGVTIDVLSRVRLPEIIRQALRGHVVLGRDDEGGSHWTPPDSDDPVVIYLTARACGEHPTKAVAAQLGISHAAAAQRIARARKAGLIPPTKRGAH
jgi:hypothetical protein